MKADFTRRTFRPEQHYVAALQQQGRVPIDADWNEQIEIQQHRDETETRDVIGPSGFPKDNSFLVEATPDGLDICLTPGRAYVDGILCELDAGTVTVTSFTSTTVTPTTWTVDGMQLRPGEWVRLTTSAATEVYRIISMPPETDASLTLTLSGPDLVTTFGTTLPVLSRVVSYLVQPEWWVPEFTAGTTLPSLTLPAGIYLAYLDVWRRHVTAIEDPTIREVALGGPDTCTRVRTTWQLRLTSAGPVTDTIECEDVALPPVSVIPSTGMLSARAFQPAKDASPCVLAPTARYRSLENQLYRVEIHTPGKLGEATFKYSIDNGTVLTAWTGSDSSNQSVLNVGSTGKDSVLRFSPGDWVELTDDTRELAGQTGTLMLVDTVGVNTITVSGTAPDYNAYPHNPRIRRWDQSSPTGDVVVPLLTGDGFITLESGVQVRFEDGYYNTGDYWLIPARTITTDVEWPRNELNAPLPRLRQGIEHHYAKLGLVTWDGSKVTAPVHDCRPLFPPLTDIHAKDVKMDPGPCQFPDTVKTVADAIAALCQQKDNACCELVIAPGQDVQATIDAALVKNRAAGIFSLHVCFADGTHTLTKPLAIFGRGRGSITVSGCGLGSHVVAPTIGTAILLAGWKTATVTDLTIAAGIPPRLRTTTGDAPAIVPEMVRRSVAVDRPLGAAINPASKAAINPAASPGGLQPSGPAPTGPSGTPSIEIEGPIEVEPTEPDPAATPSAALLIVDCGSSVVVSAAIVCGGAPRPVTACIAVIASKMPFTKDVRVTDCDLTVGNMQVGVALYNINRSTVEGNRIDVATLSAKERPTYLASKDYLGKQRKRLLSDLRVGPGASKTVETEAGATRVHITFGHLKVAFTTDAALAASWSTFIRHGGFKELERLARTVQLSTGATSQPTAGTTLDTRKDPPQVTLDLLRDGKTPTGGLVINTGSGATTPPPAPAGSPAPPSADTPVVHMPDAIVTNDIVARIRHILRKAATRILRMASDPTMTKERMDAVFAGGFYTWKQGDDQLVAPVMAGGILVAGTFAGDVRILDNSIAGTRIGIKVAVTAVPSPPSAPSGEVMMNMTPADLTSVNRARISGNSIGLAVPVRSRGSSVGIYVGNCRSLILEDNYTRRAPVGGTCGGILVKGVLGTLMRGEGNHALNTSVGIRIVASNATGKAPGNPNVMWILSENVGEQISNKAIIAPPDVVQIHNAPS